METIIGFVAGYVAGAQDGKDGIARLRTSLVEIRNSPEVRRMAGEALGFAEQAFRRLAGTGVSGTVSGVTDILVKRAVGRRESIRAA